MANNPLRSFASGIIIATSIFTVVYYFQPLKEGEQTAAREEQIMTEDDVQQYLTNKGYISIPKDTYDELVAKNSKENEKIENTDIQESEARQEQTNLPNQKEPEEKKGESETPKAEEDSQQIMTYQLTIKSGMDSIKIANILEKSGIVKSSAEFEQFLVDKKWNRSVQIGTYELNSGMSYEAIGRIITKK